MMKFSLKDTSKITNYSLAALVLFIVIISVHFNSIENPFYFDDFTSITLNRGVSSLGNLRYVFNQQKYFELFAERSYRPVTSIIFLFLKQVLPPSPSYWRLINLLLHFANTFLLYLILVRFGLKGRSALLAVSLFAVHTLHTETINVISFNREIIGGFFSLLAFYCFFQEGRFWRSVAAVLFFLSCLTKETFIVLPALLFLFEWFYDARFDFLKLLKSQIGNIIAALLFLFISFYWMRNPDPLYRASYPGGSLLSALLTFSVVFVYYLKLFFQPTGLSPIYDFPVYASILDGPVLLALLLMVLLTALVIYGFSKRQAFSLYFCWFFLYLLPTANIIPTGKVIAERFTYFPLMGMAVAFILLVGWIIQKFSPEGEKIQLTIGVVFLLFLSVLTIKRHKLWQDPEALWLDAITRAPSKSAKSHGNLGYYFHQMNDYDKAIKHYQLAIKANSLLPNPYRNLAGIYQELEQYNKAKEYYEEAILRREGYQDKGILYKDLRALAKICFDLSDFEATIKYLNIAKTLNPTDPRLFNNLVIVYQALGKEEEATQARKQLQQLRMR